MNIIIPLGGIGKRFADEGYVVPKPLIKVHDKAIIIHLVEYLAMHVSRDDHIYIIYNSKLAAHGLEDAIKSAINTAIINIKFVQLTTMTLGAADTVHMGLNQMQILEDRPCLLLDGDTFYKGPCVIEQVRCLDVNAVFYFKDASDVNGLLYSYIEMDSECRISSIAEKQRISENANTGAYYFRSSIELQRYTSIENFDKFKEFKESTKEYYTSCVIRVMLDAGLEFRAIEVRPSSVFFLGTPNLVKEYLLVAERVQDQKRLQKTEEIVEYVFDLDGTLVITDAIYEAVWSQLLKTHVTPEFFIEHIRGRDDASVVSHLGLSQSFQDPKELSLEKDRLFISYIDDGTNVPVVPGAVEFIQSLGRPITIVTNCNRASAEKIISALDINVRHLVVGNECTRSKPHPDPYLYAIEQLLGTSTDNAIIFEDSSVGLQSARAAKPRFVIGVGVMESSESSKGSKGSKGSKVCDCTITDYSQAHAKILELELARRLFGMLDESTVRVSDDKLAGGFIADVRAVEITHHNKLETLETLETLVLKQEQDLGVAWNRVAFLKLHEHEVVFYQTARDRASEALNIPECFMSSLKHGILLENLNLPGWSIGLELDDSKAFRVLDRLAALHSIDAADFPKIPCVGSTSWVDFVRSTWPGFREKWATKLSTAALEIGEEIYESFAEIEAFIATPPLSLCHGDVKSANMFFDPSMEPYFIDWQYATLGKGTQDVVFFLIESFDADFMRLRFREFKEYYFSARQKCDPRGLSREEYELEFRTSAKYFPFFVAMWFGTMPAEELVDKTFPSRFIDKLFSFLEAIETR